MEMDYTITESTHPSSVMEWIKGCHAQYRPNFRNTVDVTAFVIHSAIAFPQNGVQPVGGLLPENWNSNLDQYSFAYTRGHGDQPSNLALRIICFGPKIIVHLHEASANSSCAASLRSMELEIPNHLQGQGVLDFTNEFWSALATRTLALLHSIRFAPSEIVNFALGHQPPITLHSIWDAAALVIHYVFLQHDFQSANSLAPSSATTSTPSASSSATTTSTLPRDWNQQPTQGQCYTFSYNRQDTNEASNHNNNNNNCYLVKMVVLGNQSAVIAVNVLRQSDSQLHSLEFRLEELIQQQNIPLEDIANILPETTKLDAVKHKLSAFLDSKFKRKPATSTSTSATTSASSSRPSSTTTTTRPTPTTHPWENNPHHSNPHAEPSRNPLRVGDDDMFPRMFPVPGAGGGSMVGPGHPMFGIPGGVGGGGVFPAGGGTGGGPFGPARFLPTSPFPATGPAPRPNPDHLRKPDDDNSLF